MNIKFLNQTKLTGTVTPTNSAIAAGDDGQVVAQKLQGQINAFPGLPVSLANGGTNANLTASNGGIFYSSSTAGAILAGTATAGQILRSGASTTPAWSTATYPASTTINRILYSSSDNVIGEITTGNNGVIITSGAGVPSVSSTLPSTVQGNITSTGALATGSLAAGFTAVTVPLGGTGVATTTAYGVLCGGTTATGVFQNAGAGSATQVLTSNGAAALPTWADLSTGSITNYSVHTGNITLSPTSTAWQNVTGTTVTLPAGTYLITYLCSITAFSVAGVDSAIASRLYNTTDAAETAGTASRIYSHSLTTTSRQSGCGGATVIVTLAAQKILQLQISTSSSMGTGNDFSCPNSTITVIKTG
jgi:hypothetical protein